MDIKDINRIALGEGEVLWVTVARGNLPMASWTKQVTYIQDMLQTYFLTTQIIVTSDDINIQAIKEDDICTR